MSHTRATLFDTIASLWESDGGVITVPEVLELLSFIIFWTMLCLYGIGIQLVH